MHQHQYSSSCRLEGSLQRLKSHIGSMIRHNATITQIMLQQAVFRKLRKKTASKSCVLKNPPSTKKRVLILKTPHMTHIPHECARTEIFHKYNFQFFFFRGKKKREGLEKMDVRDIGHLDRISFRSYFGHWCPQLNTHCQGEGLHAVVFFF